MNNDIKTCPLSGAKMNPLFSARIMGKYDVTYYYCENSGIIQTERPYWLNEAYSRAISDLDTGLVSRNLMIREVLEPVLFRLYPANARFVDVGGGYGLLTRLLRDRGFDCYTTDKYCESIFARHFQPQAGLQATALFAYEVFEHIEDPKQFLTAAFANYQTKTILFSTEVYEHGIPDKGWWYYAFEGGQHITFYQPRSLRLLAESLGCKYYRFNYFLHIITDQRLKLWDRVLFGNIPLLAFYYLYVRLRRWNMSKTREDHFHIKELIRAGKATLTPGAKKLDAPAEDG